MSKIQCLMSVNALAAGVEDLETSVVLDAVLNEVTKCIEELTERKMWFQRYYLTVLFNLYLFNAR